MNTLPRFNSSKRVWLGPCLATALVMLCVSTSRAASAEPFEIPGWQPEPAKVTAWSRWLNTFDFRKGAGDPDFFVGNPGYHGGRPSNYRTMDKGRFGEAGAPLYPIQGKRTRMGYQMGSNCPTWQATIELFVRSKSSMAENEADNRDRNIWNDAKTHYVLFLGNADDPPKVSLIKTSRNTLAYHCNGTTIELPVNSLKANEWYHLAISWDAKTAPGRLWLTINGKGITAEAPKEKPLQPLSYAYLTLGNSPNADKDLPLSGVVDELHISDETLADRTPAGRAKLAELPVDWSLYGQVEEAVRLNLLNAWPTRLPYEGHLWNKYGGATQDGWHLAAMYEAYDDPWFLAQAERVGKILLKAQWPAGHFAPGFHIKPTGKAPLDVTVEGASAYWAGPNQMRIQDGFQNVPMAYLIYMYRLTGKTEYLDSARKVGDVLIDAQNPNGSWSGMYDLEAKTGRTADRRDILGGGEFDDGGVRDPFFSLLLLYNVTKDTRYLKPLAKTADWVLEAEIVGSGARGWASFYDANNKPIWARKGEPPKLATRVFPNDIGHLMIASYLLTGDRKYMDGIRPALAWYQKHRQPLGWAYHYNNDGTPYRNRERGIREWYGPEYGHFRDITYIEEAMNRMDKGTLRPETSSLKVTPQTLANARDRAIERLRDPELLRWVRRDVHLLQRPGSTALRGKMIEYLLAVRIAAGKVPARLAITGAPMPGGMLVGERLRTRCWLAENWFDTPLRKK